jgi:tetratricopeptide (TPR) repeat protein
MFCGTVLGIYGLMQYSGSDFIDWNNPYNSIISTLGNPNFAAAIMAIFATLTFGFSLSSRNKINVRIFSAILTLVLFITIYLSNARQGLLSFALGSGTIIIIKLYNRKKLLGHAGLFFGLIIAILSIFGMLQIGPFERFLYKGSVTIRGFYWRAGIKMFVDHPITGVGIDRYGSYFKSVRESQYPLNYGYDITSTNAHNVFIQMFATGGIFVGLTYLLINLFIGYNAIKTLRKTSGENRLIFGTIFAAWLSFQAQSVVSIDNIGLSVWGWVLGGSILALSYDYLGLIPQTTAGLANGIKVLNPKRALVSGGAALISVILIVFLYRGEVNSYNARAVFNPQDQSLKEISQTLSIKVIQTPLVDPYYSLTAASYLISNGYVDEGMKELLKLNASDPRNLDTLNTLAGYSEGLNNISNAIKYRIKISEFDPWNAKNYLQLGIDYKLQNDLINAEIMLKKVIQIAPNSPISKQATEQLNKS